MRRLMKTFAWAAIEIRTPFIRKDQISARGIAFRRVKSGLELVIVSVRPSLRWVSFDDAIEMLAFKNERSMVEMAREMIWKKTK